MTSTPGRGAAVSVLELRQDSSRNAFRASSGGEHLAGSSDDRRRRSSGKALCGLPLGIEEHPSTPTRQLAPTPPMNDRLLAWLVADPKRALSHAR